MKFRKLIDKRTGVKYDWVLTLSTEEEIRDFHESTDPGKVRSAWITW